jgi:hypothetical protein
MVDSIGPRPEEAIMLIPFLIIIALLTVTSARSVQREVRIYQKNRRERQKLRLTAAENLGWDYKHPPRGKHRLKDTPRAHRQCTRHDPCAYKVRHLKGIPATTYVREAEEEREAREAYLSKSDYHTLTGWDAQPYYHTSSAA